MQSGLPIVQEDSPEIANDVDNEENRAFFAMHRKIAATRVTFDRMGFGGFHKQIVYSSWGSNDVVGRICCECEQENYDEDDDSVNVICKDVRRGFYTPHQKLWTENYVFCVVIEVKCRATDL